MKIVKPSYVILQWPKNGLEIIEEAGRTCYKSEDKITETSAEAFVKTILKRGHESVIEHAVATVKIVCDRGVSHELVRHRLASYSQESTRYCAYKKGIAVVSPFQEETSGAYLDWKSVCEIAEQSYLRLLERGVSPQIARSVLPISLKTEIVITANFREWRHIFRLRTSKAAHPMIRSIMLSICEDFAKRAPALFEEFVV